MVAGSGHSEVAVTWPCQGVWGSWGELLSELRIDDFSWVTRTTFVGNMGIIPTEADGQGCIEGVYMTALVGLIMGSDSDWVTVEPTVEVLAEFGIPFEVGVVSAHRTPEKMLAYARAAQGNGLKCIIACAGGAAHLPGMVAAATPLPVIGIPRALDTLDGMDSLLSIVQMPAGVPVATVSIGGAKNAGLLAVRILGAGDPALLDQMAQYQEKMRLEVEEKDRRLRRLLLGE